MNDPSSRRDKLGFDKNSQVDENRSDNLVEAQENKNLTIYSSSDLLLTSKEEQSHDVHFDIHASIVFQLGESLITDDMQAVLELVKNAYDADARTVSVNVDADAPPPEPSQYPQARGYVVVEDTGDGMTQEDIERGWLTISNSLKRAMKAQGRRTGRGRTPLGDKGLGRLGTQRLGDKVEIVTRPAGSEVEFYIGFSWSTFSVVERLSEVRVPIITRRAQRTKGTTIIVSDLRHKDAWRGSENIIRLQRELSKMLSPYGEVQEFTVTATVGGRPLNLASITQQIRRAAQLRYAINYDEGVMDISGKASYEYFRPEKYDEAVIFRELIENDEGQAFFDYLTSLPSSKAYNLQLSSDSGWFVNFGTSVKINDLSSLRRVEQVIADPGPFKGEVDYFDFNTRGQDIIETLETLKDYRQYVQDLAGIRVYRNGFAVRVDSDWLGLGTQWTKAKSFYTLRPQNTLGYIAITAERNAQLVETTNREGFQNSPHYENFYELLQRFVKFTEDIQSFLRRGYNTFKGARMAQLGEILEEEVREPARLVERISAKVAQVKTHQAPLEALQPRLEAAVTSAERSTREIDLPLLQDPKAIETARRDLRELRQILSDATPILKNLSNDLNEIIRLEKVSGILESQISAMRDQATLMHEAVGLGLIAELIAHEVNNISDGLSGRSKAYTSHLRRIKSEELEGYRFSEYVQASAGGLRKQVEHLDPALRYVREKREIIDLIGAIEEIAEYFKPRLESLSAKIVIKNQSHSSPKIYMNRGKFTQIIDNLIINSEYWLRLAIKSQTIKTGLITLEVSKSKIFVYDNGPGVDLSIEHSLFESFVSAKKRGEGRGLGLFIVRQLMDSEGCGIVLLPERNTYGRRFKFELDFEGAINEG